jgi:hypothetical protein
MNSLLTVTSVFRFMAMISITLLSGCKPAAAEDVKTTEYGNFTIQQKVRVIRESFFSVLRGASSETSSYLIECKIFYKGKKIKFPARLLPHGGEDNYLWRVFILKDAPVPTLLAGSENMFLITEENGKVKISTLKNLRHADEYSDAASIQWLDSNKGQPGDEEGIAVQNDVQLKDSLTLQGGNYLLINQCNVLNVKTLQMHTFKLDNTKISDDWKVLNKYSSYNYQVAIGFSEQFKQVVFRGLDNLKWEKPALICFHYITDSVNVVPFSLTKTRLERSIEETNSAWLNSYFKWNEQGILVLRADADFPYWTGKLKSIDSPCCANYELYPVKESMINVFLDFLKRKYNLENGKGGVTGEIEKSSSSKIIRYKIGINNQYFQLEYGDERKLVFDTESYEDAYRTMIITIGTDFNKELSQGKYQEYFDKYKGD